MASGTGRSGAAERSGPREAGPRGSQATPRHTRRPEWQGVEVNVDVAPEPPQEQARMAWDSSSFCKAFADMRRASSSRALVKEKERHAVAPQELPTEARQAREAQIERSHRLSFVAFHLTGPFGPSEVAGAWLRGPGCRKQAPFKRLLETCLRQLRREVHRLSMELEKCPSDASKDHLRLAMLSAR